MKRKREARDERKNEREWESDCWRGKRGMEREREREREREKVRAALSTRLLLKQASFF